jgi:hypothetical protein
MKKSLITLLLAGTIGLLSCTEEKIEYSNILHENAVVTNKVYTPKHSEENFRPVLIPLGDGILGMNSKGGVGVMNSTTFDSEKIPEEYGVIIKSQTKTFKEKGPGIKYKNLYNKLEKGQKVDVSYKEIYRAFYKDINKDGKKELVKKTLVDTEFLDANLREK